MTILSRIVLAVALAHAVLAYAVPAVAEAPKQAVASPALQTEFDGFLATFRAALKANDSAAVAGMTRLPFQNDNAYRDAALFRAKAYPRYFTARNRACLLRGRAVYDRNPDGNEAYFIFCGQLIFVFTKTNPLIVVAAAGVIGYFGIV